MLLLKIIKMNKFSITLFLKILAMLLGFFASIYIIKKLSLKDYGTYTLLTSIITLSVMIFTFNIQELLFVRLSRVSSKLVLSQIISTTNTTVLFIYLFLLVGVLSTPLKGIFVNIFNLTMYETAFEYTLYYIVVYSLILTFMRYFMFTSQSVKYSISELTIATLWMIPFLFFGVINVVDLMFYKFLTVFFILFCMFIIFYVQNNYIGIFQNFNKKYLSEAFIFGMATFLPSLSLYLLTVIDVMLLSYYDSNEAVALFSFGNLPFMILNSLLASTLILILLPKLNNYNGERNTRKYLLMSKIFTLILTILLPIFIFLNIFTNDIILLLAKKEYLSVSGSYIYFSITLFLMTLTAFLKQELYLKRQYKKLLIVFLPAIIINICLNSYLIELYSYMGAVYSMLITYMYIFVSLSIVADIFKNLYIRSKDIFIILSANVLLCISLLTLNSLKEYLHLSQLNSLFYLASVGFLTFGIYIYFAQKRKLLAEVLK